MVQLGGVMAYLDMFPPFKNARLLGKEIVKK